MRLDDLYWPFVAACLGAWGLATADLSRASDAAYADCDGCPPWAQGPHDLDPSSSASTSVTLDVGRGCVATLSLSLVAGADGACGPGNGSSCSEPLGPCTFTATFVGEAPVGVRLFWNDGTYGTGAIWQELAPDAPCSPKVFVERTSRKCGVLSFIRVLAWDTATGATADSFVTLGCYGCPLED